MKSPVQLKVDRDERLIKYVCADCGSFSLASWSKEIEEQGAEVVEMAVERESRMAQRAACKCEPVKNALTPLYQIKDAFDRPLIILGRTNLDDGTYMLKVKEV